MTTRQLRALRGAAATGIAVLLGAVSHTYGGGEPPALWLVLAVAALSWPVATMLVATRLGPVGLAAAAVVSQLALHTAFAVTAGAMPVSAGAHHHGELVLGPGGHLVLPDAGMLVAHGVAAVIAALVLGYGQRWLRRIAGGIRTAVHRIHVVPRRPQTMPRPVGRVPVLPARPRWARTTPRRGPPVCAARTVLG